MLTDELFQPGTDTNQLGPATKSWMSRAFWKPNWDEVQSKLSTISRALDELGALSGLDKDLEPSRRKRFNARYVKTLRTVSISAAEALKSGFLCTIIPRHRHTIGLKLVRGISSDGGKLGEREDRINFRLTLSSEINENHLSMPCSFWDEIDIKISWDPHTTFVLPSEVGREKLDRDNSQKTTISTSSTSLVPSKADSISLGKEQGVKSGTKWSPFTGTEKDNWLKEVLAFRFMRKKRAQKLSDVKQALLGAARNLTDTAVNIALKPYGNSGPLGTDGQDGYLREKGTERMMVHKGCAGDGPRDVRAGLSSSRATSPALDRSPSIRDLCSTLKSSNPNAQACCGHVSDPNSPTPQRPPFRSTLSQATINGLLSRSKTF